MAPAFENYMYCTCTVRSFQCLCKLMAQKINMKRVLSRAIEGVRGIRP